MLCQTKQQLDAKSWDAWKDCENAETELHLAANDKAAYSSALVTFRQTRKDYHAAVDALREHRAKHRC